MVNYLVLGPIALAAIYIFYSIWWLLRQPAGNEKMREVGEAIQIGARTYLNKQYRAVALVAIIVLAVIYWLLGPVKALGFALGAITSSLTGYLGMNIAVRANVRTAEAARRGIAPALNVAFRSGSIMGLGVVVLGLLAIFTFYLWTGSVEALIGLGFGASFIAIFARVGGGIYTKAADVGADLVGKVEAGIPEDDPRNPAVVADNVGDNVGDVAGMGADLFESYVNSIIAAMLLGAVVSYPLLLAAVGIVASVVGALFVRTNNPRRVIAAMNTGLFVAAVLFAIGAYTVTNYFLGNESINIFWSVITGLILGLFIGFITNYYTSNSYRPTRGIAEAASTGAATNIIAGLATGMISTALPVLLVAAAVIFTNWLAGIYGIAIAAVGMLATLGISLATDTYGPVADNAAGIVEMAGLGQETRERAEALDAVGNTTAAVGKGLAIGSAALTALALLVTFFQVTGLEIVNLREPIVLAGLFVGALLPFLFSALSMRAVGEAAMRIVGEVRRQFRDPDLMAGQARPDYARVVAIATEAALYKMVAPSLLAVAVPVAVGFGFGSRGAEAIAGLLIGAIVTGFLMAVMMANAGGAWDNAKKYIEAGHLGGKKSDVHKAAVIGDTVGDPLKDTAGPSLNILIKIVSIVSLLIAPLL